MRWNRAVDRVQGVMEGEAGKGQLEECETEY